MKKTIVLTLAAAFCMTVSAFAQTYKVGDYYPDPSVDTANPTEAAKVEGIVFQVSADGKHGKIFSLKEGRGLKWSTFGAADYTDSKDNGKDNMDIIQAIEPEFDGYPAFAWAASLGEGWYIPAIDELAALRSFWGPTNKDRRAINARVQAVGGTPLATSYYVEAKGTQVNAYYYSSTENADKANKVWTLSFNSSADPVDGLKKSSDTQENLVYRAIKAF